MQTREKTVIDKALRHVATDRMPLLGADALFAATVILESLGLINEMKRMLNALSETNREIVDQSCADARSSLLSNVPWALERHPELYALWDIGPAQLFLGHHGEGDRIVLGSVPWACSASLLTLLIPWSRSGIRTEHHGIGGRQATAYLDTKSRAKQTPPVPWCADLTNDWQRIADVITRRAKTDAQTGQEGTPYYWLQDSADSLGCLYAD